MCLVPFLLCPKKLCRGRAFNLRGLTLQKVYDFFKVSVRDLDAAFPRPCVVVRKDELIARSAYLCQWTQEVALGFTYRFHPDAIWRVDYFVGCNNEIQHYRRTIAISADEERHLWGIASWHGKAAERQQTKLRITTIEYAKRMGIFLSSHPTLLQRTISSRREMSPLSPKRSPLHPQRNWADETALIPKCQINRPAEE